MRVVFAKDIDSADASVRDEISLTLDHDISLGGEVVAKKGSAVTAALINADAGHGAAPGKSGV